MFKNALVGVDGHDGGRDAIALATNLLSPGGELTLAHIYTGDPHIYRDTGDAYDIAASNHALDLLTVARDEAQTEANLQFREAASIGRGLHELAELQMSDLLVIGSCRRGLLGRVLVGDDTRAALNGAPCAVAIAPTGYSRTPAALRKIGVAYDGSPESVAAFEVGRALGHELGAQLSAFEAVPSTTRFGPGPLPLSDKIDPLVARARDRVAGLGGVEPYAGFGDRAEELGLYSASLDLLVMGSRGYGPIGRLVHGSTCHQLLRTARCALLVLPRSATAQSAFPLATGQTGMVASQG